VLTIRKEQFDAISATRRSDFEDRVARHLLLFFPDKLALLRPDELRAFIRHGSTRASIHGLNTERDICKYLDIMCVFGRDFDTDKRLTWAAEILRRPFRTSRLKMNRLMETALANAETDLTSAKIS
jgi:hypothetical protein